MTLLKPAPSTLSFADFMQTYGGIYEHSPWIAEAAWSKRTGDALDHVEDLHAAMRETVDSADRDLQLKLICAHPDLAGKAAQRGELTSESKSEQAGAGLDQCSPDEFTAFHDLNTAYKRKFGFPFIIAVKGLDRHDILAAFRTRLEHSTQQEFATALAQVHKIALLRLSDLT